MNTFSAVKKAAAVVFVCMTGLLFASGAKNKDSAQAEPAEKPPVLRAAALNGPSGIGMVYLFENKPACGGVDVLMEVDASPDVMLPKLLKGELDIGILPPNAAAKVYNSNGAIVMGAVVGNGMLQLMTKDPGVSSLADLKGKTVHVAGQGATPEYLFRFLLAKSGIPVGEGADAVLLDFSIPAAELAPALISGKVSYVLVPEPFATVAQSKSADIRRAIDIQKTFAGLTGNASYPMTVAVINKKFAEKYPDTVRLFLQSYAQSIGLVNGNPEEAGLLVEKHGLGLKAPVVAKAIPNAAFVYMSAEDARSDMEKLLSVFLDFAPESIGGTLPDDGFYFK